MPFAFSMVATPMSATLMPPWGDIDPINPSTLIPRKNNYYVEQMQNYFQTQTNFLVLGPPLREKLVTIPGKAEPIRLSS